MEDSIKSEVENQINILLTKKFHEILSPQIQEQFRLLQVHLVNANIGLSDMARIKETFQTPLRVDHAAFQYCVNRMVNERESFKKNIDVLIEFKEELKKYLSDEGPINKLSQFDQAMSEIKYIGKRLNSIENSIECIRLGGIERKVKVQIYTDGIEQVSELLKEKSSDQESEKRSSRNNDSDEILLNHLPELCQLALTHRFGLRGNKGKTYPEVGKIIKKSAAGSRNLVERSLWKLRGLIRRNIVKKEKIKEGPLKRAIILG